MKAAVYRRFGGPDVVQIEDVPKPEPKAGEVLIRVVATTVSIADYRMRSLDIPRGFRNIARLATIGITGPRVPVLGMDAAGVVEAVGAGVTRFKPGDGVIAYSGSKFGGHAEYLTVPETGGIALKPRNLDFEQSAALVFGGHTAAVFLKDRSDIRPGDAVLINGASGAVGSAAVQIAKHLGAVVTAVTSGANADLVRSLGADVVIDYTREDFTRNGQTYAVIADCVGNAPFRRVEHLIRPGGTFLPIISDLPNALRAPGQRRRTGKRIPPNDVKPSGAALAFVTQLAEAGALRPVIDSTYAFDDIVAAHGHVDTGRKKGNVVVRVAEG